MDHSTVPMPALPRHSARQSRRKDVNAPVTVSTSRSARHASPSRSAQTTPASGSDVISSLITSLEIVSKPSVTVDRPARSPTVATTPIPPVSPPKSPATTGSFGVDYGAFNSPAKEATPSRDISLDDLAASPPVIRTSKPPSGFSPLTAPKSPREEGGGLKSLLGRSHSASRPSSKGSLTSRDADTQSIGNLSVERGAVPPVPELRRQRSHDSWGKKQGRSHKGLMYMTSRERLRDNEDKKRASIGTVGSDRLNPGPVSPRQDGFLAEVPIREEPSSSQGDSFMPVSPDERLSTDSRSGTAPRAIPARDSSLRKAGSSSKRSSGRRTSKRDSELTNAIPEAEEQHGAARLLETPRRKHQESRHESDTELDHHNMGTEYNRARKSGATSKSPTFDSKPSPLKFGNNHSHASGSNGDIEEGAPSPAVAQGRRRDRSADARRGSAQDQTGEGVNAKRSSSRMKLQSNPASPRDSTVDTTHVGYERPPSADSIDDAVESYLCSPRLSQKIRHPQTGRVISFSEVGDSDGSAVFCCVGMGLTRYITAFYDELALTLKLRLITPDRPGVGDSEPYLDGTTTPLSWPDDVYAICQALKITKFSILAHSAGAIYALATALRMPQHIRGRIHLLAPWIPPSQMSVFGASAQTPLPPTNAIPTSQRILRALPTPILKAANSSFMTATSSSITSSLPKTPRKKRKSGANGATRSDREKEAAARTAANQHVPPLPKGAAGGSSPEGNKENNLHEPGDKMYGVPRGDYSATEEMDLFRPSHMGTSPVPTGGSSRNHKKSPSAASAAHAAREAAVLAAAASAIADRERQATYDTRLTHAIWELATTGANPAVDLLVCLERRHTIGFRYVDITRPVVIHHGSRDTRVPVENVRWLGKTMRRCEVRVLEGEGHGLMASAAVMGSVLMEISKEWEDWTRLTGPQRGDRDRAAVGVAR